MTTPINNLDTLNRPSGPFKGNRPMAKRKPRRSILIGVRLTEQEASALRKLAKQNRRTLSWMVAEAIRKMIGFDEDDDDGEQE
jgi:hypothetical protein